MFDEYIKFAKKAFSIVAGVPEKSISYVLTPFNFTCRGTINGKIVYGHVWYYEKEDACNVCIITEFFDDYPYMQTPQSCHRVAGVSTASPTVSPM